QADYSTLLDDVTSDALLQLAEIDTALTNSLSLKAISIYPSASTDSRLLWVTESNALLENWAPAFYRPFEQNFYSFQGVTVHRLNVGELTMFASQIHNWVVLSTSSVAVESALRAYLGSGSSLEISKEPKPGQMVVNSDHLDHWVQQFVNVEFRPSVMESFNGIKPAIVDLKGGDTEELNDFRFETTIDLRDTTRSTLVQAFSSENKAITLDRYIATSASAFAIMNLKPYYTPDTSGATTRLDSVLISDSQLYHDLSLSMNDEFAFVSFPESGLLSTGEFLYLRKLESKAAFESKLGDFVSRGLITQTGRSYYIQSRVLASLIGTNMVPFDDFYLSFSRDVAVISKRRGLSESVESDRNRRRVIYYNETYSKARKSMNPELSGFVWAETEDFLKFIAPMLLPKSNITGILGNYDVLAIDVHKVDQSNSVQLTFQSLTNEGSSQPYDELWILPIDNEELTGTPLVANIVGSSTSEIIFATKSGQVKALAFDGTVVINTSTNGDTPIGSPVLYDWYGNGTPIIILAAGTKIYAWNQGGNLLPQFPIEIGERISAPVVVTDFLRNGVPEIIVPTENRKIHIIDGRGQNVRGWPRFTNAVVSQKPVFAQVDGTWSLWVYSQNILMSWLRSGAVRPGYPTFINARFTSEPMVYKNQIVGSAADGSLYSIGTDPSFIDTIAVAVQIDSVSIMSLHVTNSPLTNFNIEENVLLKDSSGFYRSDLFTTQSTSGAVFMFDPKGTLRVTHSLGQPGSGTYNPELVDIDGDKDQDLMALGEYGRLFSWEVLTGNRKFDIPTAGMKYPVIADLNNDGQQELIANTREGIRCWTINKR
ncbi:MAG TPA: hypothetical protein DEQ34_00005, partial [Balneolaceae bacterium]|nr:hypothetical protein [Balneolaceae bacterium]